MVVRAEAVQVALEKALSSLSNPFLLRVWNTLPRNVISNEFVRGVAAESKNPNLWVADDSPRIQLFLGSIPRVRMTGANSAGQGLREDETDSA